MADVQLWPIRKQFTKDGESIVIRCTCGCEAYASTAREPFTNLCREHDKLSKNDKTYIFNYMSDTIMEMVVNKINLLRGKIESRRPVQLSVA